jgi:hypothetical protein
MKLGVILMDIVEIILGIIVIFAGLLWFYLDHTKKIRYKKPIAKKELQMVLVIIIGVFIILLGIIPI